METRIINNLRKMKKTYQSPEITLVIDDVEEQLCTGSLDPNNPTSGTDKLENGGDDPGNFGRSSSGFWDDEY